MVFIKTQKQRGALTKFGLLSSVSESVYNLSNVGAPCKILVAVFRSLTPYNLAITHN